MAKRQPKPRPNCKPYMWPLVVEDMRRRDIQGRRRYGVRLQPFNGRDTLRDWYEELLDAAVYARTLIWERDRK